MNTRPAAIPRRSTATKATVKRWLSSLTAALGLATAVARGQNAGVQNRLGVRMTVDPQSSDPALRVTVPGGPADQRSFIILLPEHVTVRAQGQMEAEHLYLYRPGVEAAAPHWTQSGNTLQYATAFGQIRFSAHATLVADGILFRYEFTNGSATDYDMVQAVTDPRFSTVFYDPRLERTYVHHSSGFDLLASETPQRRTLPMQQWLPARYHAQFTAPIPAERTQHRADGITYFYKSRPVDIPMIATYSVDGTWVAASMARDTGNVWSNPELTCQHVDPQVALPHGSHAVYEIKLLLIKGSLDDVLRKVQTQRSSLRQTGSQ